MLLRKLALVLSVFALIGSLKAQVRITEWMYDGSEFVEFTNLGSASVSLSGWSFQDAGTLTTPFSLSSLNTLAAGESALIVQGDAEDFRSLWNLGGAVKILSYGTTGILQRGDTLKLFDSGANLVDQLTYDDRISGPRTNNVSAWTTVSNLGADNVAGWQLSTVGDAQNSWSVISGSNTLVGNPGTYAVPEPGAVFLVGAGLSGLLFFLRRRRVA